MIAVRYIQPLSGHASFHGRTAFSVTEVSVLQAHVCEQLATALTTRHELRAFPA